MHSIARQKSVNICQSYERIASGTFFTDHGVITYALDLVNNEEVYSPYALNRGFHGGLNDVLLNFGGQPPPQKKRKFWGRE